MTSRTYGMYTTAPYHDIGESSSPMSPEPNGQRTPSSKQSNEAESELADRFSDMALTKFAAMLRPNVVAENNQVKHVGFDSGSDDDYYSAEETFKDAEKEASTHTPTKHARSR